MKVFRSLLVMIASAIFILPSLSSCLSDDSTSDIHYITSMEKSTMINDMIGNYSGVVIYYKTVSSTDSIKTKCEIHSDSIVTVSYPVSLLASYLPSSATREKEALLASTDVVELGFKVQLPSAVYQTAWDNYWSIGYYETELVPVTESVKFVVDDHYFNLNILTNSYLAYNSSYFYPKISYYNKQILGYILLKSMTYDGDSVDLLVPTAFYGTK